MGFWFGAYLIQHQDATSGGVLTVFVALLLGAFSLGEAVPSLQDFAVALGAAGFIYDTIDRNPEIDSQAEGGIKVDKFDIMFDDVHFSYPARPHAQVLNGLSFNVS